MVSLWFPLANLTDSPFEAVKVSQGCYGYWETIQLNDCKRIKLVFIIFGPGGYLSVSQWMRGPRSTGEWYDIRRERYSNIAIDNLIEEDQSRISTPLLEGTPSELPYHVLDA